jgi:hypothetical protein
MPAMMFMRRSVPEQPRSEATSGTKRHREVDSERRVSLSVRCRGARRLASAENVYPDYRDPQCRVLTGNEPMMVVSGGVVYELYGS